MKRKIILFSCLCSLLLLGCEQDVKSPLAHNDTVPQPPKSIQVENLSGSSKISYNLSDDIELLYVMAVFSSHEGKERIVKSSIFKSYVILDGFGKPGEYNVTLYAVSRSEVRSEPVNVKVNPLRALVHEVYDTLDIKETFGGLNLQLKNEEEGEYTVFTLVKDSISGQWVEYDRLYTTAKSADYSIRGFEPNPTDFAVYIMDKWKNSSDTLIANLTPLYEVQFDPSMFKDAQLADDSNAARYSPLYQLWTPGPTTYFFMKEGVGYKLPNWVTIDLGKKYIFGRFHLNLTNHANNWKYTGGTPKKFEIWGSNEPTTDWNKWTLLGAFEIIKPSGLPLGQLSDADNKQIAIGHDFDFPFQSNSFRYIRFKTLSTFGGQPEINFREIILYGQPVNN